MYKIGQQVILRRHIFDEVGDRHLLMGDIGEVVRADSSLGVRFNRYGQITAWVHFEGGLTHILEFVALVPEGSNHE